MENQLKQAKTELDSLPKDILEGSSFKSVPVSVPKSTPPAKPITTPIPSNNMALVPVNKQKPVPSKPLIQNNNNNNNTQLVPASKPPPAPSKPQPLIQNNNNKEVVPANKPQPLIQNISNLTPPPETYISDATISNTNTIALRRFFKQTNYSNLVMSIYKNMNENEKIIINQMIKNYIPKQANVFNINSYNEMIKSLHIRHNNGGGNCFFIAVANAINTFNKTSKTPIIYLEYGVSKQFSQIVIRTIVANGILNNQIILKDVIDAAQVSADEMNIKFNTYLQSHGGKITEENFNNLINDIYHAGDNYFIKKPIEMNNLTIKTPFSVITQIPEMKTYLLTNSWADERTIPILQSQLGLTVIPIQQVNNNFRIPFVYIKKNVNNPSLDTNWNKYLFLFLSGEHYEEIYFDYYTNTNNIKTKESISIFEKDRQHIVPPFYILFLLYGSFYYPLDDTEKEMNNILILNIYLDAINKSFNKIINTINNKSLEFITQFNKFFPSRKSESAKMQLQDKLQETEKIVGGAYPTNALEKTSNISYYITITLDLYPGTSIPISEKPAIACRNTKNKLNKAWADFRGLKYSIQPHNYDTSKPTNTTQKNTTQKNTTQKNRY